MQLLGQAEHDGLPAVTDRHGRARQSVDAALQDLVGAQPPAGPPAHAAAAAAVPGLAQPHRRPRLRGARRADRVSGARAPAARAAAAHRPRVAHGRQQLGRRSEQLTAFGEPRHQIGPVLEPGAVHDRVGVDAGGERRQGIVARRGGSGGDRTQVDVAEAVERDHLVAVGDRELRRACGR